MPCNRSEGLDLERLFREPDSPECRDFVTHSGGCPDCAAAMRRRHEPPVEISTHAPKVAVTGAAIVILAVIALLALSDRSGDAPQSAPGEAEQRAMTTDPSAVRTPEAAPAIEVR